MIQHQGIYLPDGERHLQGWMDARGEIVDGRGTYQIGKLRRALTYCGSFRTAVDVGAHVGMWTMQLVKHFAHVHCFEPMPGHRECFAFNVAASNVTLHPVALGDGARTVGMHIDPSSSGDTHVDGTGDMQLATLDSFDLADVDFIKIDTEGYELFVLQGAEKTLRRCRPVCIVEQKPGRGERYGLGRTDAVGWMQRLGWRVAETISGDYILTP